MTGTYFWIFSGTMLVSGAAVLLQIYLLVFKHLHLSPRAMASRWLIAAASAGFFFKTTTAILDNSHYIQTYWLVPIVLFSLGVTGLCVETLFGIKLHNRRVGDVE